MARSSLQPQQFRTSQNLRWRTWRAFRKNRDRCEAEPAQTVHRDRLLYTRVHAFDNCVKRNVGRKNNEKTEKNCKRNDEKNVQRDGKNDQEKCLLKKFDWKHSLPQ